jgi:thiol-disulfide isomerase/thioredoxin
MRRFWLALCLVLYAMGGAGGAFFKRQPKPAPLKSLTFDELVKHLEVWTTDVAVLFYAPWCPYCE